MTITTLWVGQPLGPGKFSQENVIASEWIEQGSFKPASHSCFLKVLLDVASGDSPEIKADADWPGGSREGRRSFTTDQRQEKAATTLPVQLPCTLGSLCRIKVNTIKVKFGNCNFFHWLYFCPKRIGNVPMSKWLGFDFRLTSDGVVLPRDTRSTLAQLLDVCMRHHVPVRTVNTVRRAAGLPLLHSYGAMRF